MHPAWTLLAVLALPAADASLALAASAPAAPVPLDGSAAVALEVQLSCVHLATRPGTEDLPILLEAQASPLELALPAVAVPRTGCIPGTTFRANPSIPLHGARSLPGLVPIDVTFGASVGPAAVPAADPVPPANATVTVVPAAILDYLAEPFGQLPVATHELQMLTRFHNHGNVDLDVQVTASTPLLAAGTLEAPKGFVALAGSRNHPLLFSYTPPAAGAGTDTFEVRLQPTVLLDPSIRAPPVTIRLDVSYDAGPAAGATTPRVAAQAEVANPPAQTLAPRQAPAAGLELALTALAAAALARRPRSL
jgi:hypothetical protein